MDIFNLAKVYHVFIDVIDFGEISFAPFCVLAVAVDVCCVNGVLLSSQ